VAFNDVDFCFAYARPISQCLDAARGARAHESKTRGPEADTAAKRDRFRREVETMLRALGRRPPHDPAYNPNLTRNRRILRLPGRPWKQALGMSGALDYG